MAKSENIETNLTHDFSDSLIFRLYDSFGCMIIPIFESMANVG